MEAIRCLRTETVTPISAVDSSFIPTTAVSPGLTGGDEV